MGRWQRCEQCGKNMIKVVFDTVVFVRSLINPNNWAGKIVFQNSSKYRLFVSKPVILEMLEVLQRPELIQKFKTLKGKDWNKVIGILGQAEVVEISSVPEISRDVKDDKFLVTARQARSNYLVTEDHDLLDIKEYKGTRIIDTQSFLEILERSD